MEQGTHGGGGHAWASEMEDAASPFSAYSYPTVKDLPARPLSAVESNYTHFYVTDFMRPRHDQYIYRHPNGLCVVGLAPTHIALDSDSPIIAVDFNVGKQSRTEMKATGKHKNDAHILEANSALCKVITKNATYIVRCCMRGAILEVNEHLTKDHSLLQSKPSSEGYVAIIMPKPHDWKKASSTFLSSKEYMEYRRSREEQMKNSGYETAQYPDKMADVAEQLF